jgi:hypothetical protein
MLLVTLRRVARRLRRGSRAAFGLLVLVSARASGADDGLGPRASEPAAGVWPEPGMDTWRGPLGPTALYGTSGGALWAAVSGGVAASPGERQRFFGLLELGVGLDVWAAPSQLAEAPSETEEDAPAGLAAPPVRADAAGSAALGQAPAPLAPRPAAGGARREDPAVAALLARAAVAEALRVQAGAAELARLDGMAARSRAAASLPEVRVGAGTSRDESLRLNHTLDDPARYTRDGRQDLWFEARLTWRLDGALFTHDEIAIMRLRAQQREEAARLAREVLGALLDWQRARLVLESPLSAPEELDRAIAAQFGAAASLDVLTDGWFSRRLELSRTPLAPAPRGAPSE